MPEVQLWSLLSKKQKALVLIITLPALVLAIIGLVYLMTLTGWSTL